MAMMIVNGVKQDVPTLFVSQAIYDACWYARPWSPERYHLVEMGNLLSAWITWEEKTRLLQLTTMGQLETFIGDVGLRPILRADFEAWQQGKRPYSSQPV